MPIIMSTITYRNVYASFSFSLPSTTIRFVHFDFVAHENIANHEMGQGGGTDRIEGFLRRNVGVVEQLSDLPGGVFQIEERMEGVSN